jgi:hypothetical protein
MATHCVAHSLEKRLDLSDIAASDMNEPLCHARGHIDRERRIRERLVQRLVVREGLIGQLRLVLEQRHAEVAALVDGVRADHEVVDGRRSLAGVCDEGREVMDGFDGIADDIRFGCAKIEEPTSLDFAFCPARNECVIHVPPFSPKPLSATSMKIAPSASAGNALCRRTTRSPPNVRCDERVRPRGSNVRGARPDVSSYFCPRHDFCDDRGSCAQKARCWPHWRPAT